MKQHRVGVPFFTMLAITQAACVRFVLAPRVEDASNDELTAVSDIVVAMETSSEPVPEASVDVVMDSLDATMEASTDAQVEDTVDVLRADVPVVCDADLQQSSMHCGRCGNNCGPNRRCFRGTCGPDAQLALGFAHTCLRVGTRVTCWGDNRWGNFGTGTTISERTPGRSWSLPNNVRSVSASNFETYFVLEDDSVLVAGRNIIASSSAELCPCNPRWCCNGALAPTTRDIITPRGIPELGRVRSVTTGGGDWGPHACALGLDGSVWCWGVNAEGGLGVGDRLPRSGAVRVTGLPVGVAVQQIAVNSRATCALLEDRSVWCWGPNNYGLSRGIESGGLYVLSAVRIWVFDEPTYLRGGGNHQCAVTRLSGIECFGWSGGVYGEEDLPSPIPWRLQNTSGENFTGAVEVVSGGNFNCLRTADGRVFCWGNNQHGVLARSDLRLRSRVPVPIAELPPIVSLEAGNTNVCALSADGEVWCWGSLTYGAVGTGALGSVPQTTPARVFQITP